MRMGAAPARCTGDRALREICGGIYDGGALPLRGERNSAGARPVERERNWISAPRSALWSAGGDFPLL